MTVRQRLKLQHGGRFDPKTTADRLEGLRKLAGVSPKDVGSILWPNQKPDDAARSWYKRVNEQRKQIPFSLPEIEKAVDYLVSEAYRHKKLSARVLPGFPFLDIWVSIRIERGDQK